MSEKSLRNEWESQFDLIPEETPFDERPEERGVQLTCRIEGCLHEERLEHFGKIKECNWTKVGYDEAMLTNGATLHLGYCPAHSLPEDRGKTFPLEPAETYGSDNSL